MAQGKKIVCRVLIYSGRPDPEWELADKDSGYITELWNSFPPADSAPAMPSHFGYKGCLVTSNEGETWYAYGGIISLNKENNKENRFDSGRKFEKFIVSTAPEGILPAESKKWINP